MPPLLVEHDVQAVPDRAVAGRWPAAVVARRRRTGQLIVPGCGEPLADELLPSVLRGAAASDLPPTDAIARLDHRSLVLAWVGDPGHPESTAERLHELLPNSELLVARKLDDLFTWSATIADFLGPSE